MSWLQLSVQLYGNTDRSMLWQKKTKNHRLNMELDLQSLCTQLYSLAEAPQSPLPTPHPPAFGLVYKGAIGQPR